MSETKRWEQQFKEAARHHGDECVGLAIGIRALDIVVRELGLSKDVRGLELRFGTKKCLGDAFEALLSLEKGRVEYLSPQTDVIHITNGSGTLELHLTPKKIMEVASVFEKSDEELFPVIKKGEQSPKRDS